jgi:hypothetical protein
MALLTSTTSVSSHIMTEVLNAASLAPLRARYALQNFLNQSNIDGIPSKTRKIPKRLAVSAATAQTEGVALADWAEQQYDTAISLTPAPYAKGLQPTLAAVRRVFPGASRESVLAAVQNGDPEAVPFIAQCADELMHANMLAIESASLALFSGLSESSGTTSVDLTFSVLIDAQTRLMDNRTEHQNYAFFIDSVGIGDLRVLLASGVADSGMLSAGVGEAFLHAVGSDAARAAVPFGSILGSPVYQVDSTLQATANAGADRVGAVVCIGRGETGAPNSLRGFAELCYGHALSVDMEYDINGDVIVVVGRTEWAVGEHTDSHGVKIIYDF